MMMPLLIFIGLVYLTVHFTREKNLARWRARFVPWQPVARVFVADVRATRQYARDWPERRQQRREMRSTHIPDDLSDM
jgi:hypothetical protein